MYKCGDYEGKEVIILWRDYDKRGFLEKRKLVGSSNFTHRVIYGDKVVAHLGDYYFEEYPWEPVEIKKVKKIIG